MKEKLKELPFVTASLAFSILLGGCATTAPNANFSASLASGEAVDSNDKVEVALSRAREVELPSYDMERLKVRIAEKIEFERGLVGGVNKARNIKIEVFVTKYDKGSVVARAMLAGLGQMHIDCRVKIIDKDKGVVLGDFNIDKTFAWGGIYGAVTSMEDIEHGLADGIAKAVCATK
jgi:hypothetical protein